MRNSLLFFQATPQGPNILLLDTCCLHLVVAVGALLCWSPWAVMGGHRREGGLAILLCGGNRGMWCPHQCKEHKRHPSSLVEERLGGLGPLGPAACDRLGRGGANCAHPRV